MDSRKETQAHNLKPRKTSEYYAAWYEWVGTIGLLFGYGTAILVADSFNSSWLHVWLSFTAPATDALNSFVPGAEVRLKGIADAGYEHRVLLIAHLYAVALVLGGMVGLGLTTVHQIPRPTERSTDYMMNSASLHGAFAMVCGVGIVILLHVGRDIVPSPGLSGMRLVTGYSHNFKAMVEMFLYEGGSMSIGVGLATFVMAFIRPMLAKKAD